MNRLTAVLTLAAASILPLNAVVAGGAPDRLRFAGEARVGTHEPVAATFELWCGWMDKGALSVNLILARPDDFKAFPLDDFEGPDGIGESRDLATWTVTTAAGARTWTTRLSGWYGVDGDGYVFGLSSEARKPSTLHEVVAAFTGKDAIKLALDVKPPEKGDPLHAEADVAGHVGMLGLVASNCLRPLPVLPPKR